MIKIQLAKDDQNGTVIFAGDEVALPCKMSVTGDFTLEDIQAMFWHITLMGGGYAQGIYELTGNICAPYELLHVMKIFSITVNGVSQDWLDEMESMAQAIKREVAHGYQP
ncbi:hypothetical protein SD961_01670 [Erwinia sp. MMLR14_017]|uniref:hypothetical protein n=1 Tax=Erwinia sp. MMLR14_017 TaxID=3093842 RepID=UPI0029904DF0|nr:hypothetical protein [Erwinia sp. MMLR14_017]MDW8844609.1 hypothetical protein [Erwinia sp. MMLR14_017]